MRIMAKRQLAGDYGVLKPGQVHPNVPEHIGRQLVKTGLAIEATESGPSETQHLLPTETPTLMIAAAQAGPSENKQAGPAESKQRRGRG